MSQLKRYLLITVTFLPNAAIYFGSYDNYLYALDKDTGKKLRPKSYCQWVKKNQAIARN